MSNAADAAGDTRGDHFRAAAGREGAGPGAGAGSMAPHGPPDPVAIRSACLGPHVESVTLSLAPLLFQALALVGRNLARRRRPSREASRPAAVLSRSTTTPPAWPWPHIRSSSSNLRHQQADAILRELRPTRDLSVNAGSKQSDAASLEKK